MELVHFVDAMEWLGASKLPLALAVGAVHVLYWRLRHALGRVESITEAYWGERRGRSRLEEELRKLGMLQLRNDEGYYLQEVGHIESCYKLCLGTPRQGLLVPSSRAVLRLAKNISQEALDGLEEFSHVWITFVFHMNTNVHKETRTTKTENNKKRYTYTAKVTPPMLKQKKGVFATRSPHRPNPLGSTLARIESVDKIKRCVFLSGCDLVHGTPIIDFKPYVPTYDAPLPAPAPPCVVAPWIASTVDTRNTVIVDESLRNKTDARFMKKMKLYKNDVDGFWAGVIETLEVDVRSIQQTKVAISYGDRGHPSVLQFDNAAIHYWWKEDRLLEIVDVELRRDVTVAGAP